MFLQSAFIRKNTPELRKALEALGYKASFGNINNDSIATSSITNTYSCISMSIFDNENPHINWKANGKRIDCGDNVNMFLALAALRDDKPDYQWFLWEHNDGEYHPEENESWRQYIPGEYWEEWWWFEVRKATVEELIEHFKK